MCSGRARGGAVIDSLSACALHVCRLAAASPLARLTPVAEAGLLPLTHARALGGTAAAAGVGAGAGGGGGAGAAAAQEAFGCAIDLCLRLLALDPAARPSATQALQHPFFKLGGVG